MKNQVEEVGNLIFQVTKTEKTFKSKGTSKFEPLKYKRKFKPLKVNDTKFIPFKSNFPKNNYSLELLTKKQF